MITELTDITIGADPEIFIYDVKKDMFISAHDIIPGSKQKPFKVPGGAIQPDGLAAEFNVNPSRTFDEFRNNYSQVLTILNKYIKKVNPNYYLSCSVEAHFKPDYFKSLPKDCKILGCDPEFCSSTKTHRNSPTEELQNKPIRFGGGHFHIGWIQEPELYFKTVSEEQHIEDCGYLIQILEKDISYALEKAQRKNQRSLYYGKMGAYRPKPYGIEYRTPCNTWVENPQLAESYFNYLQTTAFNLLRGLKNDGTWIGDLSQSQKSNIKILNAIFYNLNSHYSSNCYSFLKNIQEGFKTNA